ncbi:MAG TPA: glycoside hydrolase family 30 beta sandwich domain-containing protein [Chryseosolibacter sp.]|nr:glycoside hydrolase family 30 beta sandwich domain-containing protein [Chryseosolibacter sp.]
MDGFGYALTGGSAYLISEKLGAKTRSALLHELFLDTGRNIGVSYLRISIGASDLDDHVFSYMDKKPHGNPELLEGFSIDEDRRYLIPVIKEILALAPDLKIMASPWSAPAWMKTNNKVKGGSLKPEFFGAYANYFVRYIQEMAAEGVRIDAVTIQNEPENPNNTPSMVMTAAEQAFFIKRHLGPALRNAGLNTRIVIFDHNCDHPEYPIAILDDAEARQFVDGSAFHLYLGEIEALSKVRAAHPDKNIYFTEQWTSGQGEFAGDLQWHTKNLIIGAMRNWSRNVLEWNLAADPQFNPHTDDGGCTICQGALTIGDSVTRNVSYYVIAQASKFVRPGSVRVGSSSNAPLPNVAFMTPSKRRVLIVLNESSDEETFSVDDGQRSFQTSLAGGAVATYVW